MDNDRLVNALVGGIISIVLGFIPFSPVLGGGIAGYLEKNNSNGMKVGALSGVISSIPLFLFLVFISIFILQLYLGLGGAASILFIVFVGIFSILYTVGLGAIGGYLGVYIYKEINISG